MLRGLFLHGVLAVNSPILPRTELCHLDGGFTVTTDGTKLYETLAEYGCKHEVVMHDNEFVPEDNRDVHTQNIEIRNRWTKRAAKSCRSYCSLHSHCSEYPYRFVD